MEKKISVQEGIKMIEEGKTIVEAFEIKHYIPFDEKRYSSIGTCEALLDTTEFKVDHVLKYINFIISNIIRKYTNIDLPAGEYTTVYDELKSYEINGSNLLTEIIKEIGEDYEEYKMVFDTVYDDMVANNTDIESVVKKQIERLIEGTNTAADKLIQLVENTDSESIVTKGKMAFAALKAKADDIKQKEQKKKETKK